MKVTITIDKPEDSLNQAQQHRLKRVANVLRDNDMEVEVVYTPARALKILKAS